MVSRLEALIHLFHHRGNLKESGSELAVEGHVY